MELLISVIIPTYNRAHFLGRALDSLLVQSYKSWECLVIDDGSLDYTDELMDFYCERDPRIKLYSRSATRKKGASTCRNIGFEKSKGTYIQYLDSDDLLTENKFEEQIKICKNETSQVLMTCDWRLFKINPEADNQDFHMPFINKLYTPCGFLKIMGTANVFLPPHTYLTHRRIIELSGPWNEDLTNNDDGEFFSRVILNSEGVMYTSKAKVFYRKFGADHLSNYNKREKIESLVESWKLIENYLKANCKMDSLIYVENAKSQIFNILKNKYPCTISQFPVFFNNQFNLEQYRLSKTFIFKRVLMNFLKEVKTKYARKFLKPE